MCACSGNKDRKQIRGNKSSRMGGDAGQARKHSGHSKAQPPGGREQEVEAVTGRA